VIGHEGARAMDGLPEEHAGGEGPQREGDSGHGVIVAFGRMLKALRVKAGMDRETFGKHVGYSPATIAAFEQGRRIPLPRCIDKADEVLGADGLLKGWKTEVEKAQYPGYFRDMAALEAEATALCVYAAHAMPGLLQTENYARAVFRMRRPLLDDDVIEERLAARLGRQRIFSRRPAPLLSFIVEEVVLHRPTGGRATLRGQLEQIMLVAQQRNVEVQVMPTDRDDHAGFGGPFILIDTVDERRLAYTEVQEDSRLYCDQKKVRTLEARYGILRSQALTPSESLEFIEKLLGAE
jgi:transcriptional regulator with XRE-family HTH domain